MQFQDVEHLAKTLIWSGVTVIGENVFEIVGAIGILLNLYFVYRRYRMDKENKDLVNQKLKLEIDKLEGL